MKSAQWDNQLASDKVHNFDNYKEESQKKILEILNKNYSPNIYEEQLDKANRAIENNISQNGLLDSAVQEYPSALDISDINIDEESLKDFAIVLMAGGEGERLRLSLLENGYDEDSLKDFTKATFPLPKFPSGFGALQTNLLVISSICKKIDTDIPVIITTGPKGSTTAELIPMIVKKEDNFGLKELKVLPQNERLHLTADKKIAFKTANNNLIPATNPDETGGPIMKLKEKLEDGQSTIEWLSSLGKRKIMVLQATALYDPNLIKSMASAAKDFDSLGIGIARSEFPEKDPFGTFVLVNNNNQKSLRIVEQAVRTDETIKLQNEEGKFLPYNTGFYIFNTEILENCDLPDYATPPKEVHPDLEKAPKVGYAATDIISFAKKPAVLTISQDSFAVIKDASDPEKLSKLAKKYHLQEMCEEYISKGKV